MEVVTATRTSSLGSEEEKRIKHYSSSHKILLVGEGEFSFAACLARAFGSASNMVATSLDSQVKVMLKYSRASIHLKELRDLGCKIIHQVDAHTMSQHPLLEGTTFDRIIYNFPHASLLWRENNQYQIELHKRLVKGFLRCACEMLTCNGEVHVTHKTGDPFSNWDIEKLAEEVGLYSLPEYDVFFKWEYPGYDNKKGYIYGSHKCDGIFQVGECRTFKFSKPFRGCGLLSIIVNIPNLMFQ